KSLPLLCPDQTHQLDRNVRFLRLDADFLQRLSRSVVRGVERRRFGSEVGVELLALLLECRRGFLRSRDVLRLLHRSSDTSSGCPRSTDRAGGNSLAPQQRANDRGSDRDRGLNSLAGRLLALPFDHLFRSTEFFVERCLPRRVLAPELIERAIAVFA